MSVLVCMNVCVNVCLYVCCVFVCVNVCVLSPQPPQSERRGASAAAAVREDRPLHRLLHQHQVGRRTPAVMNPLNKSINPLPARLMLLDPLYRKTNLQDHWVLFHGINLNPAQSCFWKQLPERQTRREIWWSWEAWCVLTFCMWKWFTASFSFCCLSTKLLPSNDLWPLTWNWKLKGRVHCSYGQKNCEPVL